MRQKKIGWKEIRHHKEIYLFILPTIILVGLFAYYPASNGLIHSLFRWNGADIEEFLGFANYAELAKDVRFWRSFKVAFILGFINVLKMIPALFIAVLIHRVRQDRLQYVYRVLFVVPMVIPGIVMILLWKFFFDPTVGLLNTIIQNTGIERILVSVDRWAGWGVFQENMPIAWLGNPDLAFPALIIWGFPWVGTFAILTYLARLQGIGDELYESADLDGANAWQQFAHLELPLILSMVRVNLVFVILGTIKDVQLILLLFGLTGGPGGVVEVPALFMYREAFSMMHFGRACAIGVVLTLVVFILTKINERFLKVEH